MRPTPKDVLTALKRMDADAYARATGRSQSAADVAARRPAMAACRALGWSYAAIARAFHRDHSTVMQAVAAFEKNAALGGMRGDALLFRALLFESARVAMARSGRCQRRLSPVAAT